MSKKQVVDFVLERKNGNADPYKLVEESYKRIKQLDPALNVFITIKGDLLDEINEKNNDILAGVPIAVKDNIVTKNLRTTCASRVLENFVPSYNATVIERLRSAGALIIGKTNMDEFAMGTLGTTSAFGPTRNYLNTNWSPGGSSSGSAVAVSSNMTPLALGSDTGGSIRLPAAWNGIYGLKPTYGMVSRYGLISYAESLEQIGPMASSASDLALLYSVIMGHDPRDPTTYHRHQPNEEFRRIAFKEPNLRIIEGLKIAVIKDFIEHPDSSDEMIKAFWSDLKKIEAEGAEIIEFSVDIFQRIPQIYYVIAFSEASSNLARYAGVLFGSRTSSFTDVDWENAYSENRRLFGWEVKRRIMLGSFILSKGYYEMYYGTALKARRIVYEEASKILAKTHVIITPGSTVPPLPLEYDIRDLSKLNSLDAPLMLANLTGLPALTMPTRVNGVPQSIQLIGEKWSEDFLFTLAKALETIYS